MVINALNSGAKTFMADFEGDLLPSNQVTQSMLIFTDSNSPTWSNMVLGQANLRDAIRYVFLPADWIALTSP